MDFCHPPEQDLDVALLLGCRQSSGEPDYDGIAIEQSP